jgi:hypothetical protein
MLWTSAVGTHGAASVPMTMACRQYTRLNNVAAEHFNMVLRDTGGAALCRLRGSQTGAMSMGAPKVVMKLVI